MRAPHSAALQTQRLTPSRRWAKWSDLLGVSMKAVVCIALLSTGGLACTSSEERPTSLNGHALVCSTNTFFNFDPLCVDYADPHPNVDIPLREHRLRLEMKGVPDELKIAEGNGVRQVEVHNWRGTLAAGYTNGLRPAFPRIAGLPVLTLELVEATPIFPPAAVSSTIGVVAVSVQIRYKARLVDSAGNILKRSLGTVEAKQASANRAGLTQTVSSAVETMYEKIANDMFIARR